MSYIVYTIKLSSTKELEEITCRNFNVNISLCVSRWGRICGMKRLEFLKNYGLRINSTTIFFPQNALMIFRACCPHNNNKELCPYVNM